MRRLGGAFDPGLLVLGLLFLPLVYPLAQPGLPSTTDGHLHLHRVVELDQVWQGGLRYPRWAPDTVYGLGSPLFNYVAPLFNYLVELLHLGGLDFQAALKAVVFGCIFAAGLGMYVLMKGVAGPEAGLLAAAAYIYAPYPLRNIVLFVGNYPQFLALSLLPWTLWGLRHLALRESPFGLMAASLSISLLALSHNITAMLSIPLLVLYAISESIASRSRRSLGWVLASFGLSLGLSAFFIVPAIVERRWVQTYLLTQEFFDFRSHFLSLREVLAPSAAFDGRAYNPDVPYTLGTAQLALAVLSLGLLAPISRLPSHPRRHLLTFAIALAGYVFLMLPASRLIYEAIPPLAFTERPWRMQGPATLSIAFLAGMSLVWLQQARQAVRSLVLALALCLVLVSAFPYLYPRPFVDLSHITPREVVAYEVESGTIGTTSAGEYLPLWVKERPSTSPLVPLYLEGRPIERLDRESLPLGTKAELISHTGLADEYRIVASRPFTARFYTLYFPGWRAYLDGQPILLSPSSREGLIEVKLPAGEHRLLVRFEDTPIRRASAALSLVSLVALGGVSVYSWKLRRRAGWAGS